VELFHVRWKEIPQNATLVIGFSGWGNIGHLVMNHLVETLPVQSVGFFGSTSWFHKGRLETPMTLYRYDQEERSYLLLCPRVVFPVVGEEAVQSDFWELLVDDMLSIESLERVVILAGLREETRSFGSKDWLALVPTRDYEEKYELERTLEEHLSMVGPLSIALIMATAHKIPALALLGYCGTFQSDYDAAKVVLKALEEYTGLQVKKDFVEEFDSGFITEPEAEDLEDFV